MSSARLSFCVIVIGGVLLGTGGGCAKRILGDNQPRDVNREVPEAWTQPSTGTTSAAQQQWDEFFADPHLRALIEEALENNQELNIQLQEIIIAQAEVGARKGEYLPYLGAYAGGGVEKPSTFSSKGAADEATGVPIPLPYLGFGLSASWEIDIWSKLRSAAKAANYRYLASIEGRNFVITQIIGEIADNYYELLALDNQVEVLERFIVIQQDALESVKLKKEAARATELAVQRFEAEVLKNQGRLFDLKQQQIQAENRINFLVGRYPQPVARDSSRFLQTEPPTVASGLPSELLDNRPDIRQADMMLESAELDVKSTKRRFYPSLVIDAGIGYESFNPAHLLDTPASLIFNIAGNLVAPLLNRAAIKADYRMANATQIQAVWQYERTVLNAYTEVITYLAMIDNLKNRYERLTKQVETLNAAISTSNDLYQAARADYVEVLLTRRDALEAEMELIETRKMQMQAMVGIYRALGGGWRTDE